MSLATLVGQQIKAGTAVEHAAYTGQIGEITINTSTWEIHVHDGVTAGGHPASGGGGGGSASWGGITGTLSAQTDLQAQLDALAASIVANRIPVGGVYISVDSTNPSSSLGYGTWTAIASGRVLVGQNVADPDFDVLQETGGSKTV